MNTLLSGLKHWTWWRTFTTSLDGYAFARPEWLLLSISPVICITVLLLASRKQSAAEQTSCTLSHDAARALSAVFTPSSGGWSSHLAMSFRRTKARTSSASNAQSIQLDLSELLENIFSGNIELRETRDLSNMLRGRLHIYDFSIMLSITRAWWFVAAKWIVSQQFHMSPVSASCHSGNFTHDLDHIPCHKIEREVLRILRTHLPDATFSIEFTCFAPGITFLSPCYILCVLPFLYASRSQNGSGRNSVPSTSLQKVIGWLSNDHATTLSVMNISSEQAVILCGQEKHMVYNSNIRNQLVSDEGLIGWRRKRFMLLWEAGLLSAGLLIRWRIILKAN